MVYQLSMQLEVSDYQQQSMWGPWIFEDYVSDVIILYKHFCFQISPCGSSSGSTDHIELLMTISAWFQPQALPKISGWWKTILSIISYISSGTIIVLMILNSKYMYFLLPKSLEFCNFDCFPVLHIQVDEHLTGRDGKLLCFHFELKVGFTEAKKYISPLFSGGRWKRVWRSFEGCKHTCKWAVSAHIHTLSNMKTNLRVIAKWILSIWLVFLQECIILTHCVLRQRKTKERGRAARREGGTERDYGHRMIQTWTTKMTTNSIYPRVGLL
jgi:hypothetical protein